MCVLIQLLKAYSLIQLADSGWLCYREDARFYYLANWPKAAINMALKQLLVVMTTSVANPPIGPNASLLASNSKREF